MATYTETKEMTVSEKEHAELVERGLLNSDYGMLKKILNEPITGLFTGISTVLLQIAHPGVGKGVGNHSNFHNRVLDRGRNTAMYVYGVVFGTPEERERIRTFVTKRHKTVNDHHTDKTYDAMDPHLQLWVAATLYGATIHTYEAIMGPLSEEEADRAYQEYSILGTALQVPLEMWPKNREAFWKYWDYTIENVLEITPQCRAVTHELRYPVKNVPWFLKLPVAMINPLTWHLAAEQLPPKTREQFGLESTAKTRRIHKMMMGYVKFSWPLHPKAMRQFPAKYYIKQVRKEIAKGTW